jgi:hypothetical protein
MIGIGTPMSHKRMPRPMLISRLDGLETEERGRSGAVPWKRGERLQIFVGRMLKLEPGLGRDFTEADAEFEALLIFSHQEI